MLSKILSIIFVLILTFNSQLTAQYSTQDSTYSKFFIGSTAFVLYNVVPDDNSPEFAQLNFGYRYSHKDVFTLELKTWKYGWPLGIPYGKSFEAPDEKFPGYIREFGFAFVYQRFLWKGWYAGLHIMNAWQTFVDDNDKKVDNGFQIFNTYRLGYHFKLFNDRFFIEPSIAITHRPYHTEMPETFKVLDDKWNKIFIGEPGLHIGFNF